MPLASCLICVRSRQLPVLLLNQPNVRCSKTSLFKFPKANEQEKHVTSLSKAAPALKQIRKRAAVRRQSNIRSFQIVNALTRQ